MKLFTAIEIEPGRFHLDSTRAPDLLRRELVRRRGNALLRLCLVPPHGWSADRIVGLVLARHAEAADGLVEVSLAELRRLLWREVWAKPWMKRIKARFTRHLRPLLPGASDKSHAQVLPAGTAIASGDLPTGTLKA
jgi:hypothetical protein